MKRPVEAIGGWGYSREVVGTPFCEESAKWEPVLNLGGGIVIIKGL